MDPGIRVVAVVVGMVTGLGILTSIPTCVAIERKLCDPEVCGQQCYKNNYMNSWCENFVCYCDNDCERHRRLYPWDDVAHTCANICSLKHGPCTGSGCASDAYWTNSTRSEYELYQNTSTWLYHPFNISHVTEYNFFSSDVCYCYNNKSGVYEWEPSTTPLPSIDSWNSSQPEWKFWSLLYKNRNKISENSELDNSASGEKSSENYSGSESSSEKLTSYSFESRLYETGAHTSDSDSAERESALKETVSSESDSSSEEFNLYEKGSEESKLNSLQSTDSQVNGYTHKSQSESMEPAEYSSAYSGDASAESARNGMANSPGCFQNQRDSRFKENLRKLFSQGLEKPFRRKSKMQERPYKKLKMTEKSNRKLKIKEQSNRKLKMKEKSNRKLKMKETSNRKLKIKEKSNRKLKMKEKSSRKPKKNEQSRREMKKTSQKISHYIFNKKFKKLFKETFKKNKYVK